jgi:2-oxoglutarate dehydrogenase E1 component
MSDLNLFHGPNAGYAQELYDRYREDPTAVDDATRAFFNAYAQALMPHARNGHSTEEAQDTRHKIQENPSSASSPLADAAELTRKTAAAARLSRLIRQRGHLIANVDPLGLSRPEDPRLELDAHGLIPADLAAMPSSVVVGSPLVEQTANALEAITRLRQIYTGNIGFDDEHIQNNEERYWLREAADSGRYLEGFDDETLRELLQRLTEVDAFEQSIHKRFPTEKRFSIEGTDMLVPMLDEIIHSAAVTGTREVVMGMAHRGRLNVLAHVLGKPYEALLEGFKMMNSGDNASVSGMGSQGFSGDVKYHLGYKRAFKVAGVAEMPIMLVPNPSHLEFVNPVAEGHARAAQENRIQAGPPERNARASLAVLIHGDAAFPGQGVVPETLNMSRLAGYATGGTIHIISNNQIGFTTLPSEGRSTQYASDLAKGFEIPVVHVNADDPIACIAAARMAHDYRVKFGKDFLIDLIGYRRYGHNEAEEPELTQPEMYAQVVKHPRVYEILTQTLLKEGVVAAVEAQAMAAEVNARLDAAWNAPLQASAHLDLDLTVLKNEPRYAETAVPAESLKVYNDALYALPADFAPNDKLNRRTLQGRRDGLNKDNGILWGHAEALAFASILADGTPIRITGQDTERGTFSHRHAVLHDINNDARFVGLQTLPQARAAFAIYNSPLSEQAALGFEYGYSLHAPETLVLWEAQFGDFGNGAQIIIDQFLSAGMSKWRLSPSVVLLLPHGYEGQGPEHSSARLERYLQLCAEDNLRVANCTTPAQYFHLLRRQAALLKTDPRPLVVMTPKSLLRAPVASSSLSDLTNGTFQPVINDERASQERAEKVTRLILCSGKIYLDLVYKGAGSKEVRPEWAQAENVAAARVEELYPFPEYELEKVIAGYPNLREIVWLQEEPRNMGAWTYMSSRLREQLDWKGALLYRGRAEAASPAEGSKIWHSAEQHRILHSALEAVPPVLEHQEDLPGLLEHREEVATK